MGLSKAVASGLKPTSSVHLHEGSTDKVFYTIPDGKFFIGHVGHSVTGSPMLLNGVDSFSHMNINTSSNTASWEIILYAGDTLESQSSGQFYVHGCLYDL